MKPWSPLARTGALLAFVALAASAAAAPPGSTPPSLPDGELQAIDAFLKNYYRNVVIVAQATDASGMHVDCVDLDHQPGLNRPDGGTYTLQRELSDEMKAQLGGRVLPPARSLICPTGSVEMRELPTRERIAAHGGLRSYLAKSPADVRKQAARDNEPAPAESLTNGHYYARVDSFVNATAAQATFNLWQPSVQWQPDPTNPYLFSLGQMWVVGGGDAGGVGVKQTVEAGFTVYQAQYGDMQPHFFIYWTADNYASTGCVDLRCGAFILMGEAHPMGATLAASAPGGAQLERTIAWSREESTGRWYLMLVDSAGTYQPVGYYPAELFRGGQMSRNATKVGFGGEVFTPTKAGATPQMGSGYNPLGTGMRYGWVAYQRNLKWRDAAGAIRDFALSYTSSTPTGNGCAYGAAYYPAAAPYSAGWGSTVFYGGAGFTSTCQ